MKLHVEYRRPHPMINCLKLKSEKFKLEINTIFCEVRLIDHWNELPKQVEVSPSQMRTPLNTLKKI